MNRAKQKLLIFSKILSSENVSTFKSREGGNPWLVIGDSILYHTSWFLTCIVCLLSQLRILSESRHTRPSTDFHIYTKKANCAVSFMSQKYNSTISFLSVPQRRRKNRPSLQFNHPKYQQWISLHLSSPLLLCLMLRQPLNMWDLSYWDEMFWLFFIWDTCDLAHYHASCRSIICFGI